MTSYKFQVGDRVIHTQDLRIGYIHRIRAGVAGDVYPYLIKWETEPHLAMHSPKFLKVFENSIDKLKDIL